MQATEFLASLVALTARPIAQHSLSPEGAYRLPVSRPRPRGSARSCHPLAVCMRCSAFSFDAAVAGTVCGRERGGRACAGLFTAAAAHEYWRACGTCAGSGWQRGIVCMGCQSLGWRFVGRH